MSAPIDHGGPAFPNHPEMEGHSPIGEPIHFFSGMSLRDYFAGQALAGLLASLADDADFPSKHNRLQFAHQSYRLADAMIAAREMKGELP